MNLPILISLVAIVVSILAWHKSRVIYEILIKNDRQPREEINKLLITGKYTLLHVKQDPINLARTVYVLGRVKE